MDLVELAEGLARAKPAGWSVELRTDRISLRPSERSTCEFVVLRSYWSEEHVCVRRFFHDEPFNCWTGFSELRWHASELILRLEHSLGGTGGGGCCECGAFYWIEPEKYCPGCGTDIRHIHGIPRLKQDLAWLVASVLERASFYSAAQVDGVIRSTLRQEILEVSTHKPDHLRVVMLGAGYLTRNDAGTDYRVADDLISPLERRRQFQQFAQDSLAGERKILCMACQVELMPAALVVHGERRHRFEDRLLRLIDAYGR